MQDRAPGCPGPGGSHPLGEPRSTWQHVLQKQCLIPFWLRLLRRAGRPGGTWPAAGASLGAYARPCISGELKRYFRDKRWAVRVDRQVQELVLQVRDATEPLAQQLGRTPADSDLARHLGVSGDKLRQAWQAQLAFTPSSLDAPQADHDAVITLADSLGEEDPRLDHTLGMLAVCAHWGELPPREQQILIMDFGEELTQARIGQRLGISRMHVSRMHVSRLRARALGTLRARLFGPEPRPVQGCSPFEGRLPD